MNQEYEKIIKNIGISLSALGEKMVHIAEEYSRYFEENVVPALRSLYEDIPNLSAEEKEELNKFAENLLNNGWCMSLFLPIVVYKEDLSTLEKADAYVLKYCTNENIEKIYDTLLENDIDEEKVSNIKTCINNKAYMACSALLISMIEHCVVCDCKITDNALLKEKAIEKLKNVYNEVSSNKISIYLYLHNYSLYLSIKEVFKDIKNLAIVDDSKFVVPSRHCLLHGYSKRKYTKKDCLFLLLLLYGFVKQKQILIDRM
ncbi:MAG: hypothetical protein IKB73_02220 [Ruminococcus sp.]|nr:hypothetical protein [Ruminococcus sp.]